MNAESLRDTSRTVDILLSTYNGTHYIREMLDSLLCQSFQAFSLLVRDDGSTDETLSILEEYGDKFSGRMRIVTDAVGNVGPAQSFNALLNATDADFVLFADQDDVWLPEKVKILIEKISDEQIKYPELPILVHSDLEVVDEDMLKIADSFWGYQGLQPDKTSLPRMLIQNIVTGCAMVMNRQLIDKMKEMPKEAMMHDWWAALVASAFGHIGTISQPLIRYRQHGKNSLGAKQYDLIYVVKRGLSVFSAKRLDEFKTSILASKTQAKSFLEMYSNELSEEHLNLLEGYVSIDDKGWLSRRWYLLKNGILKHGISRNIGLLLSI